MKKYIVIFLSSCLVAFFAGSFSSIFAQSHTNLDTNFQTEKNIETYVYKDEGIYLSLFKISDVELKLYVQEDRQDLQSFESIIETNQLNTAINAGYFHGDYSHSGLLEISGATIAPIVPDDVQVTHIVEIGETINIYPASTYTTNSDEKIKFQTGPLILKNNQIQEDYIHSSLNGDGEYLRSILGTTEAGEVFFLATTELYSLTDLAEYMLCLNMFSGKAITAINLDGGTSVALYAQENEDIRLGLEKRLPFFLGVTK
ncbi:MAG: phosphodiester glycosidase family protein [Spirulinaceae cyanobacterium]